MTLRPLRGWFGYFKHSKANVFGTVDAYVRAQGAPRLRLRWPNMIDTLLPRTKICGHSSTLPTMGCGDGVHCRKYLGTKSRGKRSIVNVRTILSVATVAVGLVSA